MIPNIDAQNPLYKGKLGARITSTISAASKPGEPITVGDLMGLLKNIPMEHTIISIAFDTTGSADHENPEETALFNTIEISTMYDRAAITTSSNQVAYRNPDIIVPVKE